jgi:hypothetical protein
MVRAYGGTSISGGSQGYTIGQMPLLPETFHRTIVLPAVALYWEKEGDMKRANAFRSQYVEDVGVLTREYSSEISDPVLEQSIYSDGDIINPNLTIEL